LFPDLSDIQHMQPEMNFMAEHFQRLCVASDRPVHSGCRGLGEVGGYGHEHTQRALASHHHSRQDVLPIVGADEETDRRHVRSANMLPGSLLMKAAKLASQITVFLIFWMVSIAAGFMGGALLDALMP
jgi:hypothetical protein